MQGDQVELATERELMQLPDENFQRLVDYSNSGREFLEGKFTDGNGHGCLIGVAFCDTLRGDIDKIINKISFKVNTVFQNPVMMAFFNNSMVISGQEHRIHELIRRVAEKRKLAKKETLCVPVVK